MITSNVRAFGHAVAKMLGLDLVRADRELRLQAAQSAAHQRAATRRDGDRPASRRGRAL